MSPLHHIFLVLLWARYAVVSGWLGTVYKNIPRRTVPLSSIDVPNGIEQQQQQSTSEKTQKQGHDIQEEDSAYRVLIGNIASCLSASDLKRDRGTDGAATGWTAWIDEPSAYRLQTCLNNIRMTTSKENDASIFWTRWLKAAPTPFVIDMSKEIRTLLNETVSYRLFETIQTIPDEFLNRVLLRIVVLPSGSSLPDPVTAPAGAMVYGKLLYGGVTRFRLIGASNGKRRAGERQLICSPGEASRGWLQYGGSPRNYVAVDMGPCLLMEVELLPKGPELAMMGCSVNPAAQARVTGSMFAVGSQVLPLDEMLSFKLDNMDEEENTENQDEVTSNVDAPMDVCDLEDYFCSSTGGLRRQIDEIVRRVLDGRVVRGVVDDSLLNSCSTSADLDRIRREEMKGLLELGLKPPKGLLLHGPPGCGKTQLAREISSILNARPPIIVAAPELLDRWVGGSERIIRELFAPAEAELNACNGDATQSALHVIVIDECDAVFRKRTSQEGASEMTRASAVNQLLSKLDGINALENILLIGMTNRKELLDPALLRPGRLEVHIEIPLPDQEGRREILNIHFDALRKRGRLSQPLMDAIDGRKMDSTFKVGHQWTPFRRLKTWGRRRRRLWGSQGNIDLASDIHTKVFSGADIAGLVRCAGSIALARTRHQDGSLDSLVITLDDVRQALEEFKAGRV